MTFRLPELKAGIYRHYKGPLYLVLGYAHDANDEEKRTVVVYVGLQLDAAHTGARLAVRDAWDFFSWVGPDGEVVGPEDPEPCWPPTTHRMREVGYRPRFDYLGPVYRPEMAEDAGG